MFTLKKQWALLLMSTLFPLIAVCQGSVFPTTGAPVGIGTVSPNALLHVVGGNIRLTNPSSYPYGINIDMTSATPWAREFSFSYGSSGKIFAFGAYGFGNDSLNYGYIGGSDTSPLVYTHPWMVFKPNGSVGIGTTNPGNYKLAVDGVLAARQMKVTKASWADFVFTPGYKMLTLIDLEKFIKERSHLPEIPTTDQVTKDGIDLGEMDEKLLQKIEELTLYLIDEHKRNNQLQEDIKLLKQQMARVAYSDLGNE